MRVRQLKNALSIITMLERKREMRFSDILNRVETSKPSLSAMLSLLCEEDYIRKTDNGYTLGLRFFSTANLMLDRADIRTVSIPHMEKLHEETGERIELCLREGAGILFLHIIESLSPLGLHAQSGRIIGNIHSLAPGKIILAHMEESEKNRFFSGRNFYAATPDAIMDRKKLAAAEKKILKENCALDENEARPNLTRFASGIFDSGEKLAGVLSVPVASDELTGARKKKLVKQVRECAENISIEMGYVKHET